MTNLVAAKVKRLLKDAEEVQIEEGRDPARFFFMRPSGFPYCGLRKALDAPKELAAEEGRLTTLGSEYFTSVGTAAHSAFQKFMGRMGTIVGDYRCPVCNDVQRFATFSRCTKCKVDRRYDELEVFYKNTCVGHTDGLFRVDPAKGKKSKHYVIDYKTSAFYKTSKPALAKKSFPIKNNVQQIQMYVVLLEAVFNIEVEGWILIYLGRDLPLGARGQHVVVMKMTEAEKAKCRKRLDRWVKVHRKVLRATTLKDFDVIKKYKLCKSMQDYRDNWHDGYNGCSISPVCFNTKLLDKKITSTLNKYPIYPILEQAPKHIKKILERKLE
jgi:hypothetical protein